MALALAKESLDARERQYAVRKQELEDASKQLQDGKDALSLLLGDRLLREYRAEKENLLREMAFLAKIMELEEHRTKLEDGKPCPLCGATEHPFAEGNVPVPDDAEKKIGDLTELITKAEDQEAAIRNWKILEALARQYLAEAESLESEATSEKKAAEKALAEVEDDRAKLQAILLDAVRSFLPDCGRSVLWKSPKMDLITIESSKHGRRRGRPRLRKSGLGETDRQY